MHTLLLPNVFSLTFSHGPTQMHPQIAFLQCCKVTLVAFLWLFSFTICVSEGRIYIDTAFTKVITLIHLGLLSLAYCQFQDEKMRIAEAEARHLKITQNFKKRKCFLNI